MDTLILERPQAEKTATSAAGIGIAVCLLLFQNPGIFANDVSGITGITPDVNALSTLLLIATIIILTVSALYQSRKIARRGY